MKYKFCSFYFIIFPYIFIYLFIHLSIVEVKEIFELWMFQLEILGSVNWVTIFFYSKFEEEGVNCQIMDTFFEIVKSQRDTNWCCISYFAFTGPI